VRLSTFLLLSRITIRGIPLPSLSAKKPMNHQTQNFPLLSLEISRLSAAATDPADLTETLADLLTRSLGEAQVRIRLSHSEDLHLAQAGPDRIVAKPQQSRAIGVRGQTYGDVQLSASPEVLLHQDFTAFFELLCQHLARFAELNLNRRRNAQLQGESRDLRWSLNVDKLLSRATGIVSSARKIQPREALEWLREESRRQRVPLWQLADRLVEGQKLSHRFGQESRPMPLRKTA